MKNFIFLFTLVCFALNSNVANSQTTAAYVSNTTQPWSQNSLILGMNEIYPSDYTHYFYNTVDASQVFVPGRSFVFVEGGNSDTSMMLNFLNSNMTLIESWVNNGGILFISAATNESFPSDQFSPGFGITSTRILISRSEPFNVNHPFYTDTEYTPIIANEYIGSFIAHNVLTGPGLDPIIKVSDQDGNAGAGNVFAEKTIGSGKVLFSGMTTPFFLTNAGWQPQPQMTNMLYAMIDYGRSLGFSASVDNVTYTSGDLTAQTTQDSQTYFLVAEASATAPTESQIIAGVDYNGVNVVFENNISTTANTSFVENITGLTYGTDYTVYFVSEFDDGFGNQVTSDISSIDFTTLANDTPVVSSIDDLSFCVGETFAPVAFTVSDDFPAAPLTVTATSSNQSLIQDTGLTISNSGSDYQLAYTFVADAIGSTNITITVTDGEGESTSQTFEIALSLSASITATSGDTAALNSGFGYVVDSGIIIVQDQSIDELRVSINNLQSGDNLAVSTALPAGVTSSFNATTGVLSISGSMTDAQAQSLLQGVEFSTTSTNLSSRDIEFTLGSAQSLEDNGHFYEFVSASGISWQDARTAASNRSLYGLPGYLATVTSQAENDFIFAKLAGQGWIGASDASTEDQWLWVTGPEAGTQFWQGEGSGSAVGGEYNNWSTNEPNDSSGEDYAHFKTDGTWNDFAFDNSNIDGYVVEYGGLTDASCVQLSDIKTVTIEDAEAACAIPISLTNWIQEGDLSNGSWTLSNSDFTVTQGTNSNPTFFVSQENYFNTSIQGEFGVFTTTDDDFFGFVLGYQAPTNANPNNYQMILFDWKQADQSGAMAGMRVMRFNGGIANQNNAFWEGTDPGVEVLASNTAIGGWADNTWYDFKVTYSADNITIFIDGTEVFNIDGTFEEGRFGFYNYSQEATSYRNFSIPFEAIITKTDETCSASGDGTATANVNNLTGSDTYTYDWTGPSGFTATTETITGLDPGIYNVTVFNQSGCVATSSTEITTIVDIESPIVVTQDIIVQLDNNGEASILPAQVDNGSTDNCAIDFMTVSPDTFDDSDLANAGVNTVVLTVFDETGNQSSANATVTVEDNIPPFVSSTDSANDPEIDNYTCGSTHTFNAGPSSCVALVSVAKPVWDDNVSVVSTSQSANNNVFLSNFGDIVFGNFPVGTTDVTFAASDSSGNQTLCTITIVVIDNQLPTITNCAADFSVNNTAGSCDTLVNLTIPTAGDNCSVASVTYVTSGATVLNGNDFPNALTLNVGVTNITYTVTDASGNTTQCAYNVTVIDNELPVITCTVSDQEITADDDACSYTHTGTNWDATATDNCTATVAYELTGATTSNGSSLDGVAFNVGTTTVTWTATDPSGNTSECSFDVVITDDQLPVITNTPSDISVSNDTGACGAVVTWTAPTATDNCSIASLTSTHNSGDVFPVGTTTVVYTATDIHNNVSITTQFDVEVTDDELPVIANTPSDISVNNDLGICGAAVTWTLPTAIDNCSVDSLVSTHNPGDVFPVGTTTVVYTATDIHNNVSTTQFDVVVTDNELPVIVNTPADISVNNDLGICGAVVTWTLPTASDNCSVDTLVSTHNSGDEFPVGTTTVVYTATDIYNNVSTTQFDVVVTDDELPVIVNTPADISVNNDLGICGAVVTWTLPTASDNCGFDSQVIQNGSFESGLTAWTAINNPNPLSPWTAAPIIDTGFFPAISPIDENFLAGNGFDGETGTAILYQDVNIPANGGTLTWDDQLDYDLLNFCDGCSSRIYEVQIRDLSNNVLATAKSVTALAGTSVDGDWISNSYNMNAFSGQNVRIVFVQNIPDDYSGPGAFGLDNVSFVGDSLIQTDSSGLSSGDVFPVGTTTVVYTSTDIHNNVSTTQFDIVVTDNELPVIANTPVDINVNNDLGICGAAVTWTLPTASDNCSVDTLVSTHNSGDVFPVGTTTVVYTATDIYNNVSTTQFDVVVTDNELPVIANTPADISVNNDLGICGAAVTWTLPTASDNCSVDTLVSTHNSGDEFPVGTTTVVYTATDIYNNVSTTQFDIVVIDNELPVIANTPADISVNNDLGICGAVVTWTLPTASDNCDVDTFVSTHNSGDEFPVGTTTVVYTATDIYNNVSTTQFDVVVTDNELPVIANTPADISVNNDLGICGAAVTWTAPTATDNCDVDTLVSNHNSGDEFPVGTTTVVYTATDIYNNVSTTQFDVVVTDDELPVIAGTPADISVNNDLGICGAVVTWTLPTASDNCDVDTLVSTHNSGDVFPVGTTTVVYTATDIHNNVSTTQFDVVVTDNELPVIVNTPADISVNNDLGICGAAVTWTLPTASDNCSVDTLVSTHNSGDEFPVGTTTVVYTATDIYNNVSTTQFDIVVIDNELPVIANTPADISVNNDLGICGAVVTWTLPTASDNCDVDTFVSTHNSGDEFPVGTTT
ncbi:HYR domain-containing protein, partial [Nonlabens sp.]|uniref:HYR domain-containing protein n=1 Tax=Nonlabens sp. TaxID=1888209 RepID=UPI003F6A346C